MPVGRGAVVAADRDGECRCAGARGRARTRRARPRRDEKSAISNSASASVCSPGSAWRAVIDAGDRRRDGVGLQALVRFDRRERVAGAHGVADVAARRCGSRRGSARAPSRTRVASGAIGAVEQRARRAIVPGPAVAVRDAGGACDVGRDRRPAFVRLVARSGARGRSGARRRVTSNECGSCTIAVAAQVVAAAARSRCGRRAPPRRASSTVSCDVRRRDAARPPAVAHAWNSGGTPASKIASSSAKLAVVEQPAAVRAARRCFVRPARRRARPLRRRCRIAGDRERQRD